MWQRRGLCPSLFAVEEVSFKARRNYDVGDAPVSVAVEDFNGDTFPDVAVAHWYGRIFYVYLGDGMGSLGSPV